MQKNGAAKKREKKTLTKNKSERNERRKIWAKYDISKPKTHVRTTEKRRKTEA